MRKGIFAALLLTLAGTPVQAALLDYVGQCVPFARAASGIEIFGAAWTWWDQRRVLMLTHANWSRQNGERGHAEQDVTVYDVSRDNDWSEVKVWYRDAAGLGGTVYRVNGFIYAPGKPARELTGSNPDYVGAMIDAYR